MAKYFIPVIKDGYLDHFVTNADSHDEAVEKAKEDPLTSYVRNPATNETFMRVGEKWERQTLDLKLKH